MSFGFFGDFGVELRKRWIDWKFVILFLRFWNIGFSFPTSLNVVYYFYPAMILSPHFSLAEMLESQTARRKGITEQFSPPAEVIENLKALCTHILEPLRIEIGKPIGISSGYRCAKLNRAIGGAKKSQHVLGQAADLKATWMTHASLFHTIQEMKLPFDQLIWEYGTKEEPAWVHVSYGERHRRQVLWVGV